MSSTSTSTSTLNHIRDIDDLHFGSTPEEKDNELAVKLYSLSRYLTILQKTYLADVQSLVDIIQHKKKSQRDEAIKKLNEAKGTMNEAFYHLIKECDYLLGLKGKKTKVKYANSVVRAEQNNKSVLEKAKAKREKISIETATTGTDTKKVPAAASHTALHEMNKKFRSRGGAAAAEGPLPPPPPPPQPIRKKWKLSSSSTCTSSENRNSAKKTEEIYPRLIETDDRIIIDLSEKQHFELPKPCHSNTEYSKIYTMREAVVHLSKYRGNGMYPLFHFMHQEGLVGFSRSTFQSLWTAFRKDGEKALPPENMMRTRMGRPRGVSLSNLCSAANKSTDDSYVKDNVREIIESVRSKSHGDGAKKPSSQTVRNNAHASSLLRGLSEVSHASQGDQADEALLLANLFPLQYMEE